MPFECGNDTEGAKNTKMSVKFYLTAILFVVFDIEVVFMYPWAALFKGLGWVGFFEHVRVHHRAARGACLLLEERSPRMGELTNRATGAGDRSKGDGFATTKFESLLGLGAEILALHVPVRDGVLRHGVHVRVEPALRLLALRL